jgi:hypothetical protein
MDADNNQDMTSIEQQDSAQPDIERIVEEKMRGMRDRMFADVRRTIEAQLGKKAPKQNQPSIQQPEQQTQSPANTSIDERVRLSTSFARSAGRYELSDSAYARMERAFWAESPENPTAWVKEYAADFGLAEIGKQPQQVATQSPTEVNGMDANRRPPVTGDAPGAAPKYTEDTPVWQLSPSDREALIRTKGGAWYRETVRRQLKSVNVRLQR